MSSAAENTRGGLKGDVSPLLPHQDRQPGWEPQVGALLHHEFQLLWFEIKLVLQGRAVCV